MIVAGADIFGTGGGLSDSTGRGFDHDDIIN